MIPHFLLQQNKGEFLIIRDSDAFHIIDCNEVLTKEKRLSILESGCTPAQMQEMGLSGTTIPRSDIEAITITGCGFQDDVIFYLGKKKKLCYWFPQAYEQKKVDDFFRGIPRKMVKTRYRLKGGSKVNWRVKERNMELYRKFLPFGWVWNGVCAVTALLPFVLEMSRDLWGWIVMGLALVTVLLDVFFPAYFSILGRIKGSDRTYGPKHAIHLGWGLSLMLLAFLLMSVNRFHFFDEFRVLPVALAVTAVLGGALFLFCREFLEEPENGLVAVLFLLLLNFVAFVPQVNHSLGPELTPVTATVQEKRADTTGKMDHYYCYVRVPDGRELQVSVSRAEYREYEIGDTMALQLGTGFFGIEYAIDG